jgi:DNA/RNA endonuclease YhcR with UshA esterase domain
MKRISLLLLITGFLWSVEVTIYDIQYTTDPSPDSTYPSPYFGQEVTVTGVVTASSGIVGSGFFLQEAPGPWHGIYVYTTLYSAQEGDSVRLTGIVDEYYGLTEIKNLSEFTILKHGVPTPDPVFVHTADLSSGLSAESYEGVLVYSDYVVVTNPDLGYGEWEIDDGSGPTRVDDYAGYSYTPQLGDSILRIIGVQYYSFGNYKLEPRSDADIIFTVDGSGTASITPLEVTGGETHDIALEISGIIDTLRTIEVEFPQLLEWNENLELQGEGFSGATYTISGGGNQPYLITIENASVAENRSGTVLFFSVGFPAISDFYIFPVRTAGEGGTPVGIPEYPEILVTNPDGTIPMSLLHRLDENGNSLLSGRSGVKVKGVVTVAGELGPSYYMQDTTGGVVLYSPPTSLERGDTVVAVGTVTQYNGLLEFNNIIIEDRKSGSEPVPIEVTCSLLSDSGEAYEGRLVILRSVTTFATYFPSDETILIQDSTGSFSLFVDQDTDLPGRPIPQGPFNVVGVISQYDTDPPYTSGYQIIPRGSFDIVAGGDGSGRGVVIDPVFHPGLTDTLELYIEAGFDPLRYIEFTLPTKISWSGSGNDVILRGDGFVGSTFSVSYDTTDSAFSILIEDAEVISDTLIILNIIPEDTGIYHPVLKTAVSTIAGLREVVSPPIFVSTIPIGEIQQPDSAGYNSSHLGENVIVAGVVTGPSDAFSPSGRTSFFIQDETGGIDIYSSEEGRTFTLGELVLIGGQVTEYNGLTEVSVEALDSIKILGTGYPLPQPYNLRVSEVLKESLEGLLVHLEEGRVGSQPIRAGAGQSFYVWNGQIPITVYVYDRTGIDLSNLEIGDIVNITGIVGQYDTEEPYDGGYQLLPRFPSDIEKVSSGTPAPKPSISLKVNDKITQSFSPDLGEVLNIKVSGPLNARYTLKVFDLHGRLVKTFYEGLYGPRDEIWDGRDKTGRRMTIGMYIIQLRTLYSDGKEDVNNKLVVIGTPFK